MSALPVLSVGAPFKGFFRAGLTSPTLHDPLAINNAADLPLPNTVIMP
jgi:hypothetical protein